MRILLLNTWLRNIGNGFIDKGARAALESAFPQAEIYEMSGYPFISADRKALGELEPMFSRLGRFGQKMAARRLQQRGYISNVFNIADAVADVDLAVLPGCVLTDFALRSYSPVVETLNQRGIPLLLLGVGGGDYRLETQRFVTRWLNEFEPLGMITRDADAFTHYRDAVDRARNGIDCAFFIDEWYTPPTTSTAFIAKTFDKVQEPQSDSGMVVRPDHNPFGDAKPFDSIIRVVREKYRNRNLFKQPNVFLSDSLRDYLFVYANASETHSDRIHACVPALVYGNEARFYFDSPRDKLFDNVLRDDIKQGLVSIDDRTLERKKSQQTAAIKQMIDEIG